MLHVITSHMTQPADCVRPDAQNSNANILIMKSYKDGTQIELVVKMPVVLGKMSLVTSLTHLA